VATDFTFEFLGLPPLASERAKITGLAAHIRDVQVRSGAPSLRSGFVQVKVTCYAPPASGLSSPISIMDGLCQALLKARMIGNLADVRDIRYRRRQGAEARCVVTLSRL
jgi:hypothetical protein